MKFAIGKKIQMSQVFAENGVVTPITIIRLEPKEEGKLTKGSPSGTEELPFVVGDIVKVSGKSKGKGFQGVVKRHGFHGGPRTHGQKHSEREPGSIGGGGRAGGRVVKGMRMAGRMGGNRVTVKNLRVVSLAGNELSLSGAVPGRRGTLLQIRSAKS